MTYTIVALDERTGEMGVAVQSHFFAVAGAVPWAEEGVGVVATQSFLDRGFGPGGLRLLRQGLSAERTLDALLADDPQPAARQVCVLDADGGLAHWTGDACLPDHGAARRGSACALGNMLASPEIPEAMLSAYETASGRLEVRLLAALAAAEALGGDSRGAQAAGILTTSRHVAGGGGVSLRVDDHPEPVRELARLVGLQEVYADLGAALFADGAPTPDRAARLRERSLVALGEVATRLPTNLEPVVWRGMLLAQAGRDVEARACFDAVPALAPFVDRLRRAGYLEHHP